MAARLLLLSALCLIPITGGATAEELRVLAAGSLREAMNEIGERYGAATGTTVAAEFGPSGLLRERIDHADLLASADMGHPLKLLQEGRATRIAMFTRNTLCGIALPRVGLTTANFLDRLLDPVGQARHLDTKGRSIRRLYLDDVSPGRRRAPGEFPDPQQQGAADRRRTFEQRSCRPKDPIVAALAAGRIDVMISYCSGAKSRLSQMPELQVAAVPREIAAGPEYGLAVLEGANPKAADLALFILSPDGQQILSRYGSAPIGLPAPER